MSETISHQPEVTQNRLSDASVVTYNMNFAAPNQREVLAEIIERNNAAPLIMLLQEASLPTIDWLKAMNYSTLSSADFVTPLPNSPERYEQFYNVIAVSPGIEVIYSKTYNMYHPPDQHNNYVAKTDNQMESLQWLGGDVSFPNGIIIKVVNVHLAVSLFPSGRLEQMENVVKTLDWEMKFSRSQPAAVIIGGDFNSLGNPVTYWLNKMLPALGWSELWPSRNEIYQHEYQKLLHFMQTLGFIAKYEEEFPTATNNRYDAWLIAQILSLFGYPPIYDQIFTRKDSVNNGVEVLPAEPYELFVYGDHIPLRCGINFPN